MRLCAALCSASVAGYKRGHAQVSSNRYLTHSKPDDSLLDAFEALTHFLTRYLDAFTAVLDASQLLLEPFAAVAGPITAITWTIYSDYSIRC